MKIQFSSWRKALEAAGFEVNREIGLTKEEI